MLEPTVQEGIPVAERVDIALTFLTGLQRVPSLYPVLLRSFLQCPCVFCRWTAHCRGRQSRDVKQSKDFVTKCEVSTGWSEV